MLKKIIPYMKKYRLYAILCPLLMVVEVMSDIFVPYMMSLIVDHGITQRDFGYVLKIGGYMVGFALFAMAIGIISSYLGAKAGYGFSGELRAAAFRKVQDFSFANIDQMSVPSLITRLTNDCDTIGQVAMMSLRMAVRAPALLIFALIMAIRVNAQLALVFAVSIPAIAIFIAAILKKAQPMFKRLQKKVDGINAIVQEDLIGIRVVKSFNRQGYEEGRFKKRNEDLLQQAMKAISLIVLLMPIMNLIVYITIIAVLWIGGNQVMVGTMGGGELIAFVTYITQIMLALMLLSMYFMQYTRGSASAARVIEILETEPEIHNPEHPIEAVADGSIVFENVNFRYPGYRDNILKEINLDIASGETIGIIGSTGSSKTTLVQMIPRLYDVSEGTVYVGGHDVKDYDMSALREEVAFVLQKNTLFSGTIRSNMLWGDENASDEQIVEALKNAEAWEFVSKYADGLDHPVEQGGTNFSGGQRQRLTIARALVKHPKILILDDSTSAVDMTTDKKIRDTFKTKLKGITKLIIAQRIASIKEADRIIVLEQGAVQMVGTHAQLAEHCDIYKEILDSQQEGVIEG